MLQYKTACEVKRVSFLATTLFDSLCYLASNLLNKSGCMRICSSWQHADLLGKLDSRRKLVCYLRDHSLIGALPDSCNLTQVRFQCCNLHLCKVAYRYNRWREDCLPVCVTIGCSSVLSTTRHVLDRCVPQTSFWLDCGQGEAADLVAVVRTRACDLINNQFSGPLSGSWGNLHKASTS